MHDHENEPPTSKGRETALTIGLTLVLGGVFLFFLNLVSLGIFFYVAAALVAMVIVGYLHYVLWGYDFSQEVAGEREEEELKNRIEEDPEFERDKIRHQGFK